MIAGKTTFVILSKAKGPAICQPHPSGKLGP
jgi:hypothetical protein